MRPVDDRDPAHSIASLMGLALLGYVLLAMVGSFVPFDAVSIPLDEAVSRAITSLTTMPPVVPRIDFVSNVILFVPLGFLLTGYLAMRQARVPGGVIDVWITLLASVTLSASIEVGQVFFPARNVSPSDIMGETLGGLIGAGLWLVSGGFVWRALGASHRTRRPRSLALLLLVSYTLLYAAAQLLPFDITLEPSELAEKFRAGRIVLAPFASGVAMSGSWLAGASLAALAAAPLGALLVWAASRSVRAAAVTLGLVLVAGVEAAQVLVVSRVADTTDIVFGAIGLLSGAWLAASLAPAASTRDGADSDRRWPAVVAAVVWLLGVAIAEWTPFDFSLDPDLVARHWAALTTVPFLNYFAASEWNAFVNLVQKMMLVIPLGILIGVGLRVDQAPSSARAVAAVLQTGLLLAVIEVGQVYLPSRAPDMTDVILGTLGAGLALLVMAWFPSSASQFHGGTSRSWYEAV
jgi:glycopeptide antibiotics resistance protein